MSPSSRGYQAMYWHILHLLLLLVFIVEGGVQNSCFLNNGQCRYQIQVISECDPSSRPLNHQQRDSYLVGATRGEDNEIEKYLLQVRTEHSNRIDELENKVNTFLKSSDFDKSSNLKESIPGRSSANPKSPQVADDTSNGKKSKRTRESENSVGFEKDPKRKENRLLNRLHKEFSKLRNELARKSSSLDETERLLASTQLEFNQSESSRVRLSHQLRHTESKLEEEQAKSYRLRKSLATANTQLNETKSQLSDTTSELRKLRVENWKLQSLYDDCQQALEECERQKAALKRALEQALIKYHELNLRHDNLTQEHNKTQEELITCYIERTPKFCGFEDKEICGFQQQNGTDKIDWVRWRKSTPSGRTGPSKDHTCGNGKGHYMYVEATQRLQGDNALLLSPRYFGYGEQCVEFYYHMYGYHVGTLYVYTVRTLIPGVEIVPMWRAFGNQGDVWSMARIPIPADEATKGYQVVFEGTIGFGNEADIAIDDFRVLDGSCYGDVISSGNTTSNATSQQSGNDRRNKINKDARSDTT